MIWKLKVMFLVTLSNEVKMDGWTGYSIQEAHFNIYAFIQRININFRRTSLSVFFNLTPDGRQESI